VIGVNRRSPECRFEETDDRFFPRGDEIPEESPSAREGTASKSPLEIFAYIHSVFSGRQMNREKRSPLSGTGLALSWAR